MESINMVVVSGNVGSIQVGTTGSGASAVSLLIAIDGRNDETLWMRANAYGAIAKQCQDKIDQGDYVVVSGELMERKKSDDSGVTFIEVRIQRVIFEATIKKNIEKLTKDLKNDIIDKVKN